MPSNNPIQPNKKKSKLSYHKSDGKLEVMCKTSVTRYGALGKNKSHSTKRGANFWTEVLGLKK
jgi:hypothetical protein